MEYVFWKETHEFRYSQIEIRPFTCGNRLDVTQISADEAVF